MLYNLTLDQIRLVDRVAIERFGIPGLVLMENAGRGAADFVVEHTPHDARYVILCGTGNNGGDGLVIARHLHARGRSVVIIISGSPDKLSHDCAANLSILQKTRIPIHWCSDESRPNSEQGDLNSETLNLIARADVIIDALLGTGSYGAPRGHTALLLYAANANRSLKFAIDTPSGLNMETGHLHDPTFLADFTLTFVAAKPCFEKNQSKNATGTVVVLPIGVPPEVIEAVMAHSSNP